MAETGSETTKIEDPSSVQRRITYFQELEKIRGSIAANNPLYKEQDASNLHETEPTDLRLVLIGRTGEGKSATGNLILGSDSFLSKANAKGVTAKCVMKTCVFKDRKLLVVDTPGLFDGERSNEEIRDEILKFTALTAPGPHAFLLTVMVNRDTPELSETFKYIEDILGSRAHKHTIVVFNRKDDLDYHHLTITDYLTDPPPNLKALLESVGKRYLAVNNRVDLESSDRSDQVNELLTAVQDMLKVNHGTIYSSRVLTAADYALCSYTWEKDKLVLQEGVRSASKVMVGIQERARELEELKRKEHVQGLLKQKGHELSLMVSEGDKKVRRVRDDCYKQLAEYRDKLREEIAEDKVSVAKPWFVTTLLKSAHTAFRNLFP